MTKSKRKSNVDIGKLYSADGVYGRMDYGVPAVCKGLALAVHVLTSRLYPIPIPAEGYATPKVLTVGAGNGYEIVYLVKRGYDVTGVEFYVPDVEIVKERTIRCDASDMPFEDKSFDFLLSAETMEHVKPEISDKVLLEMGRVAGTIFLTIATRDDPPFYSHINIHDGLWWVNRFKKLGFDIKRFMAPPLFSVNLKGKAGTVSWPDGVFIVACH